MSVFAHGDSFFADVLPLLDELGQVHIGGFGARVTTGDGLTALVYQIENYAFEWDPGPWHRRTFSGQPVPDLRGMTCLLVETRSGDLAARLGRLVADRLSEDVWFVDHNDVVWAASDVDPKVIRFV